MMHRAKILPTEEILLECWRELQQDGKDTSHLIDKVHDTIYTIMERFGFDVMDYDPERIRFRGINKADNQLELIFDVEDHLEQWSIRSLKFPVDYNVYHVDPEDSALILFGIVTSANPWTWTPPERT